MGSVKVLLTGLAAVSVSMASISGKVTDASGIPIPQATVQLENGGQPVITDANGVFSITATGIKSRSIQTSLRNLSATMAGGMLRVSIAKKCVVEITAFNQNGKALSNLRQTMASGTHSFSLPRTGAGVCLYRIKAGSDEVVLRGSLTDGESQWAGPATDGSLTTLAKQAQTAAAINDVIAVTKSGYLNYRMIVTNPDTSGVAIKMIASAGTLTDVDGNVYQTVKIGTQVWTVENLRVTKYNDGTPIPLVTDSAAWFNSPTPAFCYYNNTTNADSIRKFGAIYNWFAADTKKLAPVGWHVPSNAEWNILTKYLVVNGYNWDGTTDTTQFNMVGKSLASMTDWITSPVPGAIGNDLTKNNTSGFSGLPAGYRDNDGMFGHMGEWGDWMSADSDAFFGWYRHSSLITYLLDRATNYPSAGFSVRLVKDSI